MEVFLRLRSFRAPMVLYPFAITSKPVGLGIKGLTLLDLYQAYNTQLSLVKREEEQSAFLNAVLWSTLPHYLLPGNKNSIVTQVVCLNHEFRYISSPG